MQDRSSFSAQNQGQQQGPGSWQSERPGRSVIHTTFEISNPRDAQEVAAAAVTVPGIGFKTYEDPTSGKTRVSMTITKQAGQRLQQVQQLHQQLLNLSLSER